jgi:hypothetical protein
MTKGVSPMFSMWENYLTRMTNSPRTRALLLFVFTGVVLGSLAAPTAFADYSGIYSGSAVDSTGKVSAWGVTNVTAMQHVAYVTTTLTSPNGRRVSANGTTVGPGHSRADVYLLFDQNDLGDYTVSSVHDAYCNVMGHFINGVGTQKVFKVGMSFICYVSPTDTGGGWARYTRAQQCDVTCAPPPGYTKGIFTAGPPHPPTEVLFIAWTKIVGVSPICGSESILSNPAPCAFCSEVPIP